MPYKNLIERWVYTYKTYSGQLEIVDDPKIEELIKKYVLFKNFEDITTRVLSASKRHYVVPITGGILAYDEEVKDVVILKFSSSKIKIRKKNDGPHYKSNGKRYNLVSPENETYIPTYLWQQFEIILKEIERRLENDSK